MGYKQTKKNRLKHLDQQRRQRWKQATASMLKAFLGLGLLVAVSIGFIFGHDALLQLHYFDAQRLAVTGNKRLSRQDILDQAALKPGANILALKLSVVRNRLMSHPWIADAELHRELPGTINIRVREEQPVAAITLDTLWLVNAAGVIFKEATAAEVSGLPVIEGLSYMDIPTGGTAPGTPFKDVMEIFELGRRPQATVPIHLIDRITVDREAGLTVTAFGGEKAIRMGYGDYPEKCARLKRLIDYLKQQGRFDEFAAIDLNSPERVVATPVSPPPPEAEEKEV